MNKGTGFEFYLESLRKLGLNEPSISLVKKIDNKRNTPKTKKHTIIKLKRNIQNKIMRKGNQSLESCIATDSSILDKFSKKWFQIELWLLNT